jgi:hypothetical protein
MVGSNEESRKLAADIHSRELGTFKDLLPPLFYGIIARWRRTWIRPSCLPFETPNDEFRIDEFKVPRNTEYGNIGR